jgi:hypothetical protein
MKRGRNCTVWLRDSLKTVLSKSCQLLLRKENSNTPVEMDARGRKQAFGLTMRAIVLGLFWIVSEGGYDLEWCRKVNIHQHTLT